jgi:hypothetical protein
MFGFGSKKSDNDDDILRQLGITPDDLTDDHEGDIDDPDLLVNNLLLMYLFEE